MARGFSIQYGQIEEIFVHLLDELRQDEKNPNLWLKLKVDLDPETDQAGNSNFRLSLSEMKVDPNWDQVADIMCDPRMLKEFKRNLYEKAGI
jgi:protein required for attachment to host cells